MVTQQNGPVRRRDQIFQGTVAALTAVFVVLLCLYLFYNDNQYTKSCQQSSNGVLDLRQESLEDQSSPYHLQKDWEFYPDVMLTPNDDFSLYSHSLRSLHESSRDLREKQGTYRLTILFPDVEMSYALKLPPIFSTYRFYVNQELVLSMGQQMSVQDDPQVSYTNHILTFRASGKVQLLLQYSDEVGIYNGLSGLSAPPILGRPLCVFTLAEYHQFFLNSAMVLILLTLLLSFNVFLRSRQNCILSMIILCICAAAYLVFPLLSSKILFPIYPWYYLGTLFYFGCHAATQWLYALYFDWKDRITCITKWYSIIAIGLYALLLAFLFLSNKHSGTMFYYAIRLLQWGLILCGIILTLHTVLSGGTGAPTRLMAAASVALWAFMLCDLLMPDFSPVTFARFPEIGIICLMNIIILVEFMDTASAHQFRILYTQKMAHAEQLLKLEERHYAQLSNQVEDIRRIRHDIRQHQRIVRTLLDQGDSGAIIDYLEQYAETVKPLLEKPIVFFNIPIVDALIAYYWSAAQERGADFQVKGQLQELPPSVYVDFCSIMGNLLENALEALDRQDTDHPQWIHMRCEIHQDKLMLQVVNSNSTPVQQKDNRFQSSKRNESGMGTLSVSIIAQQYGGFASFAPENDHFTAQVFLPLSNLYKTEGRPPLSTDEPDDL